MSQKTCKKKRNTYYVLLGKSTTLKFGDNQTLWVCRRQFGGIEVAKHSEYDEYLGVDSRITPRCAPALKAGMSRVGGSANRPEVSEGLGGDDDNNEDDEDSALRTNLSAKGRGP